VAAPVTPPHGAVKFETMKGKKGASAFQETREQIGKPTP